MEDERRALAARMTDKAAKLLLNMPLWQMRPEISRFRLTSPRLRCPAGCPEEPLLAALWAQGRIGTKEIRIQADFP